MLAAAVLVTAGCGSSPSAGGGAGPSAGPASPTRSCAELGGLSGDVDDRGVVEGTGTTLRIEAGDSYFQPTCYTRIAAGTVTLTVHNSGSALHNITVPGQTSEDGTDIPAGQTVSLTVKVGGSPVPFFCRYHRTSGMKGAIVPGGR